jgi:hypothetical protein
MHIFYCLINIPFYKIIKFLIQLYFSNYKNGIFVKNIFMLKRFFIYGLTGWIMEILWTGAGSLINGDMRLGGFTNLWMFIIYGMAVFLEPIHDIIHKWRWPIRGFIWMVLIWGIEYTSGLLLVNILGVYPWLYKGPFAIDGLVRLDFAPAWFAAGLIFERIHLALDSYRTGSVI